MMGQSKIEFILTCAFCGEMNEFTKEELYESEKGTDTFKEKYCLECNEPLTMICPSCLNIFEVEDNFRTNNFFQVLPTFWNPTPSPLDELIPNILKTWNKYEEQAKYLTSETFRLSQKEFLEAIPNLLSDIKVLKQELISLAKISEVSPLEKDFKKLEKGIQKCTEECGSILASIEDVSKAVNEKKEKQLKKHVPFMDILPNFQEYIEQVKKIREKEIEDEINSLKPGYEKVKNNIKQDPTFYRNICPICQKMIFTINHQVYTMGKSDEKLSHIRNLAEYYQQSQPKSTFTRTLMLNIKIHIEKDQLYEFHGDLALVLHENENQVIGRDLLREIEYIEPESEEILFDENDPLARVSNSQFSIQKKGDQIILTGMKFDDRRVGVFFNSMKHDIRKENPDGIQINSGDQIFIPLIQEKDNPNYIEISIL
ncbi:hypothetical protein [Candidatus Lokiarchaeum ossiferum]|uniref:hypothetical protein n=1 Tax=Candidatus Lokiarchaeum ossiferum TaxID=2951803 RepID=UPI00352E07F0